MTADSKSSEKFSLELALTRGEIDQQALKDCLFTLFQQGLKPQAISKEDLARIFQIPPHEIRQRFRQLFGSDDRTEIAFLYTRFLEEKESQ